MLFWLLHLNSTHPLVDILGIVLLIQLRLKLETAFLLDFNHNLSREVEGAKKEEGGREKSARSMPVGTRT